MRLSRCDLEGALGFLREAGESDGVEPFSSELLSRLAALVRCEVANYSEIDRVRRCSTFYANGDGIVDADEEERYWATVDEEHPIRRHRTRTGELGAFKIFDFVSPKQLRQTRLYSDYLRLYVPSGYLMSLCLPAPGGNTHTFLLTREDDDFGERERTLLNLLQPHLHQLRLAAEVRDRALESIPIGIDGLLTERETEVLHHVAVGMRNREIAQALWIAPGTVKKHLDNIYAKLGVRDRTAAATRLHQRERSV